MTNHFLEANHINIHYLDYAGKETPIIALHGLTANAYAFDGMLAKWSNRTNRIIAPDLRGRGLTSHPAFQYSQQEHAADILALMDALHLKSAIFMGHSFGGLLSCYIAANYPERVERLIILDAAAQMNPDAAEMLMPTLSRLDKKFASWEEYLMTIKTASFNKDWTDDMLSYYRADVMDTPDGGVTPRPNLANIIEASLGVADTAWANIMEQIAQPTILINALDEYTLGEPLLPETKARETVAMIKNCSYEAVDGNHHSMLYGANAVEVIRFVSAFIKK